MTLGGNGPRGVIYDVKRYAIHDGPGIRTTVFFKGCPLRCAWCQNPEGREAQPEVSFIASRCIRCGACLEVCPEAEQRAAPGAAADDRAVCRRCGACAEACPSGARTLLGRRMSVAQLVAEVDNDRLFYDESGGGVTFSGGEPLQQVEFLLAGAAACRQRGIHTAVDTCGYAPTETVLQVAEHADLFLYDLKLMDSPRHEKLLGAPNELILGNLRALSERGSRIWIRVPLVPGINDDEQNLSATADFVRSLAGPPPVQVLPYHRIGSDKYSRLGEPYSLNAMEPPTAEQTARAVEQLLACGLEVKIGG